LVDNPSPFFHNTFLLSCSFLGPILHGGEKFGETLP
jgi:hypothetical protein